MLYAGLLRVSQEIKASGPERTAYVTQRDVLLSLGLAAWRNPDKPKAGWKLTTSRQRAHDVITKHVLPST